MRADELRYRDLANAILDGTPIDWASAESGLNEPDRLLLDRLKLLAVVADVHRRAHSSTATGASEERWGHLRILEPIGRGACGEVYRAWDERLDREVALKILYARAVTISPSAIIEEGRTLARVRHPNVVTLYGADVIDGRIGLWMELIEGNTLEQLVQQGRRFEPHEVAALGIELCRAIGAVHDAGLVHRDIKASNVMVADDGRVVLMDFGTGRVAEDTSRSRAGTPLYLAPELLRGGQPSVRTDLYSLGVLLYRLLSGSYPVEAQNLPALHAAHDAAERPSIVRVRADLPPRLPPVIDRALDPDPGRRYESAGALASDLQRIESRRRFSSLRLVAAGVVIVVAAGAGWETYPSRRRYAVEVDTYDRYQQARALVERRGFYSPQEAVVRLEAILSDDPTFAPAQAALVDAYAFLASGYRSSIDPDEALARMRRAAARAIELDPLLAEGHAAMGVVRAWEHRWEESESSFERALELDPTLTTTAISYSFWTLRPRLELDRAERLLETALEHDPFSLDVQRELAALRFSRGRYQDAIAAFERILSVQPDYPLVKQFLARAWILDGRASEGLALLDDESARGRENPHYRAQALIELGRRAEAERLAFENRGYPLRETVIYAALGDLDRAFEALERMAQVEPQRLPVHLTYPELERLRGDARLDRIRRQFRLP